MTSCYLDPDYEETRLEERVRELEHDYALLDQHCDRVQDALRFAARRLGEEDRLKLMETYPETKETIE